MGEEHAAACQGASEEVIGCEETCRVLGVAEGDVDEDALHDDEACCSVDGDTDGGNDPVDGFAGGPGKEEEADGRAQGGGEGWDETALLDGEAELADARIDVEVEVAAVDDDAENARDEDAEEDEADLA